MPSLGSLWYTLGIKDLTDADLKKINTKLKSAGSEIQLTPKIVKELTQSAVPKGIKIELDPTIKNDAIAKAVEGKTMRVAVTPLLTGFREAIAKACRENPPQAEVGVSEVRLRAAIQKVLDKQGFLLNISTVNDNYSKAIQAKLNGTRYNVKIHADANEITRSVQASLMQVQSRYFGLKVSRDILYRSIDEALGQKRFNINIAVQQDQARRAVQDALLRAQVMGKDQALAYQRLQTGEMKSAQAELLRLKAAQHEAASAAKAHATASVSLGGAMGRNITIAGELGSAMTSLYSVHAAKQFLSQVIEIGGELEHQKIAMDTIFGDKGKTSELFGQIKGLARQSPFGVMELTKSVKALSSYGVEYNEIYDTAKRLADISAATSVDINRLILAFGKTKSRGFLDGLEAKQFAYANIPIYEMVRKKLEELEGQAVTTAQVMERMRKREISFDIVKDVLWDTTDPGGKFYNMQEALAGSVKTSWKLVRDNIELMFGEIAESSVGGVLKDTAEVLQILTRNWQTLGTVIGAVALTFGVYKAAVVASNQMMGQANVLALQKVTASNSVAAANAMEAAAYRALTQAEDYAILAKSGLAKLNRSLLLSHRALTEAEWDAVVASKAVSNDYILRRIALGKLTQEEIEYLVSIKAVTATEAQRAASAANLKVSLASLYAMMKAGAASAWASTLNFLTRFKTGLAGLGTSVKTFKFASLFTWIKSLPSRLAHAEIGVTRLQLAFSGLGRVMSSIGTFLLNPVTIAMAAIGGLMYAWQKNNEQMENAKEIGDNVFTKATEGANNLKLTLKGIKPSTGLSDHELTQGIEQLEQAIKDYSPRPIQDINDTLVAQDGHVLTLAERYDALKKKVEGVAEAYKTMEGSEKGDVGAMISDAIKSTGGFLNDTVTVNAKDYSDALKKRSEAIRNATKGDARRLKTAVDKAIEADAAFKKVAGSMKNTAAMFNELASNRDKYSNAFNNEAVSALMTGYHIYEADQTVREDKSKFESDVQDFIKDLTASIRITWDKEIKDLDDSQKDALAIALKNMLSQADGVSEEVKIQWAKILEKAFGIDLGFKVDATKLIQDEFASKMDELLGAELADKVRRGLTLTAKEKEKAHHAIYGSYRSVFDRSEEDVRQALNDSMRGKSAQLELGQHVMLKVNQNAGASDWQRQILDELGNTDLSAISVTIKGHSDINSFIDEARKGHKAAKDSMNELAPIIMRAGISFTKGKRIDALPLKLKDGTNLKDNPVLLAVINRYNDIVDADNKMVEIMTALGVDVDANQNQHAPEDALAEAIKERINLLKKAKSEYESLAKLVGTEAASKELAESPIFAGLKANEFLPEQSIPKTLDDYEKELDKLQEKLTAKGLKTKKHRELNVEIEQVKFDINKKKTEEALKLALDKVSKEAERQLADWNLFDKIRKATGNQDLAMSIAFGMNADVTTDYPAMIKQQLQKSVEAAESALATAIPKEGESPYVVQGYNYDKLKELYDARSSDKGMQAWMAVPEEIRKAWEKANSDILKYFDQQREAVAGILTEYQTLQDKIDAINAKRKLALDTINAKDEKGNYILSDENVRKQKTDVVNTQAEWDIFRQNNDYLRFFSTIYSYTLAEAQNMGMLIEQYLDKQLQNAQISAEEYGKEMERVRQQIEKLRNVKSPFMSVLTDGIGGYLSQQQNILGDKIKSDPKLSKELFDYRKQEQDLTEQIAQAQRDGDKDRLEALKNELKLLKEGLSDAVKGFNLSEKWQNQLGDINNVMGGINNIAQGVSGAFNSIKDMADAYGVDTESGAWGDIGAVMDTLTAVTGGVQKVVQSAMSGDIGGIISGAVGTITTPFTIWSKLHDKKLQKMIERSKEAAQIMQNQYEILEKRMANFLGNAANMNTGVEGGAYGKQRELMQGQLAELEKQRQAELDKKKTDNAVVEDYNRQIEEMKIAIQDFAIEAAKAVYGIDLNGWAQQIGDALVDAFARGEDAAEAFESTVGDIMRSLVGKMLTQDLIAPMFDDVREFLFGDDGVYAKGAKGGDFKLSENEAIELAEKLKGMQGVVEDAKAIYDYINAATDGMLDDNGSRSGVSAGIQGVTEDTADLLASYINSVRADVSIQTYVHWPRLLDVSLPQISVIAQSQLDTQRQIAANTLRTAVAAEAILTSNNAISGLLNRVSQGAAKFYVN